MGVHGGPPPCTWRTSGSGTSRSRPDSSTRTRPPTLLKLLATHHIDLARFVTHRFAMADFIDAYDTFAVLPRRARSSGPHDLTGDIVDL